MESMHKKYEWGEGVFTLLSWFKMDRVKNARILVAGAGALGNEVVKDLALFGVGHIYVVDFDQVEITNLTRSVFFREEDAYNHSYKAEIVAKRAMELNPQIQVTSIVGNLFSEVGLGLYRRMDVAVGCLDSRLARYLLNRLCMRAGKPWVDGGIENLTGTASVYMPGSSCYECGLSREEFNLIMLRTGCADVVRTQVQAGRVATTPISASIIGAVQAQEAMKIIHQAPNELPPFNTLEGHILYYEGMTNRMNIFRSGIWKKDCTAHERWTNIRENPNLSASMTVHDVLSTLKEMLGANAVEINMRNNKFIDKIVADKTEEVFEVMMPESKLNDYISKNDRLHELSLWTLFHKSYYENIDEKFPYQDLTLQEIGIPPFDVIQVTTKRGLFYVELTRDAHLYL